MGSPCRDTGDGAGTAAPASSAYSTLYSVPLLVRDYYESSGK